MTIMAFRSLILFLLFTIGLFFPNEGRAQFLDPVSFSIEKAPDRVRAGEPFKVELSAVIEGKWHLYSILNAPDAGPFPTQFFLESEQFFPADYARESKAVIEYDPNFETDLGWHSKEAKFNLKMAFDSEEGISQNPQEVKIRVRYQACDDVSCLPPKSKEISFSILVMDPAKTSITRASVA